MRPLINYIPKRSIIKTIPALMGYKTLDLFRVVGSIDCILWGVVTTQLSTSLINAAFVCYDGASTVDITNSVAGSDVSSLPIGSEVLKTGLVTDPLTVINNTNSIITEDATNIGFRKEFNVTAQNGSTTFIQFTYEAFLVVGGGVIQFFCEFIPRSQNGLVI